MGADERDGISAFATEVGVDTDDLSHFVDYGERYLTNLRAIAEDVSSRHQSVVAAFGTSHDLPAATVARSGYSGLNDPFAELIAEAAYANGFVSEIRETLTVNTAGGTSATGPTTDLNTVLTLAGYSESAGDLSLQEDLARLKKIGIRSELAPIVETGATDQEAYGAFDTMGEDVTDYMAGVPSDDRAMVGRVMVGRVIVDYAIDLQSQVDRNSPADDDYNRHAATVLATQGLTLLPTDRLGPLVDQLNGERVRTSNGSMTTGLDLLVDALDLDERNVLLSERGVGVSPEDWKVDNQPYHRHQQLDRLVKAGVEDGVITGGGQALVNYTLDEYPRVVEAADDGTFHQPFYEERTPDPFNLRRSLAVALAAENYGLPEADLATAKRLAEVDAVLVTAGSQAEFDRLLLERWALLDKSLAG